ncbi:hypothetical protein ACI3E1_07210 [Ligilactobacillus sp. LYQ139]|uniref:hypothetical protein n=1 Tax=Ligilactobacillus sp. LYQ139 TaxID=3378800 RepID=UPI0038537283
MTNRRQLQKHMLNSNNGGVLATAWATYRMAHKHHLNPDAIAVFCVNPRCSTDRLKWTLELGAYGLTKNNGGYASICSAITDIHRNKQIEVWEFDDHIDISELYEMAKNGAIYQLWIYRFNNYHFEYQGYQSKQPPVAWMKQ